MDINIDKLISDFGGVAPLARLLEQHFPDQPISRAAIYKWRKRGSMPFSQIKRIARLASLAGKSFELSDYFANQDQDQNSHTATLRVLDASLRPAHLGLAPALGERNQQTLVRQLEKLGVDRIEIGQSSGHAQIGKTLATLSAVLEHALPCVVSELDEHAVLRAAELFSGRKHGVIRLHVPVEALHGPGGITLRRCIQLVCHLGLQTELLIPAQEGWSDEQQDGLRRVISLGVTTLTLHDAGQHWIPEQWARVIRMARQALPAHSEVCWGACCHDGYGLGTANTLAAIRAGANQVETTFVGEHAASINQLQATLEAHISLYRVRSDLRMDALPATNSLIASLTGANRHMAIHDSSPHRHAIGPISGRKAFRAKLHSLGIEFDSEAMLNQAFAHFRDLESRKRDVFDEDLHALLVDLTPAQEPYRLISQYIVSETGEPPQARLRIWSHGQEVTTQASGSGVVDAAFRAIENVIQTGARLVLYSVNALTEGTDSQGEVLVRLEADGYRHSGLGADTDILASSIKAYLAAANRLAQARQAAAEPQDNTTSPHPASSQGI